MLTDLIRRTEGDVQQSFNKKVFSPEQQMIKIVQALAFH